MKKSLIAVCSVSLLFGGCHNGDVEFPDYDRQTIYFAKQTPVRTVTLGDEEYADNTIDNEHAVMVKAVLGGVNTNKQQRWATVKVDPSLCNTILFSDGSPVKALPESYYNLASDRLTIEEGELLGGVRVNLTDAFFADPEAVEVSYVLPLKLVSASEELLSGTPKDGIESPDPLNKNHWTVQPQDYVLYALKYKNPYHGQWLSKSVDEYNDNGTVTKSENTPAEWEKAALRQISTKSLTKSIYSFSKDVPIVNADGTPGEKHIVCDLILDINDQGSVTVSTESEGCTASGNGSWKHKGEPKAWGDKDRDLLTLDYTYTITYVKNEQTGEKGSFSQTSKESLVMRDRQNKLETFSFIMK